jgi:hypothetical protein
MNARALLLLFVLPAGALAQIIAPLPLFPPAPPQPIKLGTNAVVPGKLVQFTVPLTVNAKWLVVQTRRKADSAKGGLIVPDGFDPKKPCPLLVISVPSGGSAIASIRFYTNVALNRGWAVVAADGPVPSTTEEDTIAFGWAMLTSVLDYLTKAWPTARQWPAVCAGFSGGAKRSGCVAAAMTKENYRVVGMFMGGCNQDLATFGLHAYLPGDRFKQVPIFLSAGTSDPIASLAQARGVKQSMERTGFKRVRLVEYDGGHRLDQEALVVALDWFLPRPTNVPRQTDEQQ